MFEHINLRAEERHLGLTVRLGIAHTVSPTFSKDSIVSTLLMKHNLQPTIIGGKKGLNYDISVPSLYKRSWE